MFLTNWLMVTRIVAASVIEAVDYPTPEEFFLAFDGTNTLFMYGGSKDTSSTSNVAIYYDGYKHETGNAYPVVLSEPGEYKALVDVCGTRYLTEAVTVGAMTPPSIPIGTPSTLAFHHGNFDNVYGDGDVSTAATNGHVYADTPTGTYSWGTLSARSTTSTNTTYEWTPSATMIADVLMVAGGGGGGNWYSGGGGGAGGLVFLENGSISGQKTVVVGNGGSGATNNPLVGGGTDDIPGSNGSDTSMSGFTTAIGGGGGASYNVNGNSGGSGGGGGYNTTGGAGTNNQGYDGGDSYLNGWGGGGGGGSGGPGYDETSNKGGNGGIGTNLSSIYGVLYGDSGFFASGGGGSGGTRTNDPSPGTASQGGGTSGVSSGSASDAQKHTGGGGGGAGWNNSSSLGGSGGSGIVLLSYQYSTDQLTYNNYNKLTIANTSNANVETNLRLGANTWDIATGSNVWICKPGDYKSFTVDPDGQTAYFGNVTVGTVSQHPTDVASLIGGFSQSSRIKLTSSDGTQIPSGYGSGTNPVASSETTLVVGTTSGNGAIYVFEKTNGVWTQVQKMTAATPVSSSYFPVSVAIHGDIIVCCTYGPTINDGFVYVFEKTNGVWPSTETVKIDPQYQRLTDIDIYGTTIVATERHETNRGRFYIFEKTNGSWPSTYTSRIDTGSGTFTWACAIHGDNLTIKMVDSSVRAYERNTTTGNWDYVNTFTIGSNSFGEDISIYGDVLAANNIDDDSNKGIVYIYKKTNGTWLIDKQIPNHGITNERFGRNIKLISSTKIIIGSDIHAYIYEEINGTWVETFKFEGPGGNNTTFGRYVSATPDGSTVFVSDSSEDTGAVFVYTKETVSPPSLTYDGYNKLAVAGVADQTLYKDSNSWSLGTASNVYIAESGEYIYFTRDADTAFLANVVVGSVSVDLTLSETSIVKQFIYDENGYTDARFSEASETQSIRLSSDGLAMALGDGNYNSNDGRLYYYERSSISDTFTKTHTFDAVSSGLEFGASVDMNAAKTRIAISGSDADNSAANAGRVYIYDRASTSASWPSSPTATITPPASTIKRFGHTVNMSDDGLTMITSGDGNSSTANESGVYVYEYASGSWSKTFQVTRGISRFGFKVAMNKTGTRFIAGGTGTAYYVYHKVSGTWSSTAALTGATGYHCGMSPDGNTVAVGIVQYSSNLGRVAVYKYSGGSWGSATNIDTTVGSGIYSFGNTPVFNNDGTLLVTGCLGYNSYMGCFEMWKYESGSWVFKNQFLNPTVKTGHGNDTGEFFGGYLSMDYAGTSLIVSNTGNDVAGDDYGRVVLYGAGSLPSLTYDGLNSLKVTGAETSSYITYKAYESNKFLACGTDLTTYPLSKTGNYKAEIAGSSTFTLTSNVLVPATNIVPLYQYPPTDGTTSGVTETVTADENSIWTVSGAGYGNGLYHAQASVAATSTSVTAYHAFDNNLTAGFETISSTIGTLRVQLPSAETVHKYVVWPKAADGNRPKSWIIEGSQDAATWTTIHTVTDSPPSLSGDIHEISSPAAYVYYRINVSANNGGTGLEIAELVLWGDVAFSITFSDGWVTTNGATNVTLGSSYTLPTYTSSLPVTVTGASDFDVNTTGTYVVVYTSVDINELVRRVVRRFVVA
jgi:hypothetical protein